jgi:HK97 family phage portal protein
MKHYTSNFYKNKNCIISDSSFLQSSFSNNLLEFFRNPVAYRSDILLNSSIGSLKILPIKNNINNCIFTPKNESWKLFSEKITFSLMTAGNSFVFIESVDINTSYLHLLDPSLIKFLYYKEEIYGYEYTEFYEKNENPLFFKNFIIEGKIIIPSYFIIHIKNPSVYSNNKGTFLTSVAMTKIKKYNYLNDLLMDFVENGCISSGIFSYIGKDNEYEDFSTVKTEINNLYNKMKKSSAIMVLQGDFKCQPINMTPREMEISDRLQESARMISQTYGVPPALLGVAPSTHQNYKEMRMFFWHDSVYPVGQLIINEFNSHLQRYKKELTQIYTENIDYSQELFISLSGYREELWVSLEKVSFLSREEKRKFFKLD